MIVVHSGAMSTQGVPLNTTPGATVTSGLPIDELCVRTIRFLAADGVEAAKSGHPGTPMGAADIAFVIWDRFLRHDPSDPHWPNRDRFVLSGGHASMLLYSMLHLTGYDLPLDELKRFRQWGSKTPGHPEYGHTVGVELTTGPLGAGFSTAVGMALAAKMLAARFNSTDHAIVDSHIYGICGDGDMQEGVTAEAASLAGHLGLGNLIFVYDCNDITIEGHLAVATNEDVGRRFEAHGWDVQQCDGHDRAALIACLEKARSQTVRPALIIAKTTIGRGAPTKAGTHDVHGTPLGDKEMKAMRELFGWPAETFHVPAEVRAYFAERAKKWKADRTAWEKAFADWRSKHADLAKLWDTHLEKALPKDFAEQLVASIAGKSDATRSLSGAVIQKACAIAPWVIGGAADLEPSTKTGIKGAASIVRASSESDVLPDASFAGRNLHFGIREHAMGSVANGMVLFGGWLTYTATFLVFSDYMRPPIRLAALSHVPTLFIFTHDSYWVGEDGPTHQPIEHYWSLRLIPNLDVWRPADGLETAMAWAHAVERPAGERPAVLLLTRQKVPAYTRAASFAIRDVWKGGYVLADSNGAPDVTIVGTGSEVEAAMGAKSLLEAKGKKVRVVSMPCFERFRAQNKAYQDQIVPPGSRVVVVESGRTDGWYQLTGRDGLVIGKDDFGASAPGEILVEKLGFTPAAVAAKIEKLLG
jgi:transketolase